MVTHSHILVLNEMHFCYTHTYLSRDYTKTHLCIYAHFFVAASVWDFRDTSRPIDQANSILRYFFVLITFVAIAIASFSLVSSMYTNIHEQKKDIGILRAIGLSKLQLYRIYTYEAFLVVTSACSLGVFVGSAIAFSFNLQRSLFCQLPIPFVFPWTLLLVVLVASVLFSVLSTFGPVRALNKRPIVAILQRR